MTELDQLMDNARTCCSEGRHAEALALFSKACDLAPLSPFAWCNRAGVLFLMGQRDEAETNYRRALDLDPSLEEAHYGLIRLHIARKDWKTVVEHLLRIKPDASSARAPEWHYLRGIALENTAQERDAAVEYKNAAAQGYRAAQKPLLRLLIRLNQPEDALTACFEATTSAKTRWSLVESCLLTCPDRPHLYEFAAKLFLQNQQYAYAARVTARAKQAFSEQFPTDWTGFKDCAWL